MKTRKRGLTLLLAMLLLVAGALCVHAADAPVAKIGKKSYKTLQSALNAAKSGDTVKLLKSVKTSEVVVINKAGKKIILNLDNHKYEYTGTLSAFMVTGGRVTFRKANISAQYESIDARKGAYVLLEKGTTKGTLYIDNGATMVVKEGTHTAGRSGMDTVENYGKAFLAKGTYTGKDKAHVVASSGTLTITGGTFKSGAKYYSSENHWATIQCEEGSTSSIRNGSYTGKSCAVVNYGTTTISGGSFYSSRANCIRNYKTLTIKNGTFHNEKLNLWSLFNDGDVTIQNGTFSNGASNKTNGTMTIKGGVFYAVSNGKTFKNNVVRNQMGTLVISGGRFDAQYGLALLNDKDAVLKVTGGTFGTTGGYYALVNEGTAVLNGGKFKSGGSFASSIGNRSGASITYNDTMKGKIYQIN